MQCLLFNYVYIKSDCVLFAMAQSNVLNCTYSGTKLFKSYPLLKLRTWVFMSNYGELQI